MRIWENSTEQKATVRSNCSMFDHVKKKKKSVITKLFVQSNQNQYKHYSVRISCAITNQVIFNFNCYLFPLEKMKVQLLLLAAFACLATSQEQQQPGEDLDSLIEGVFGKPKDQERGPPKDPNQIDINNGPPIGGGTIDIANGENVRPEDCQCVPYYQCSNGTINSDGVGLIDIR